MSYMYAVDADGPAI